MRHAGKTYVEIGRTCGISNTRAQSIFIREDRRFVRRAAKANGWVLGYDDSAIVRGRRLMDMAALYAIEGEGAVCEILGGHHPAVLAEITRYLYDSSDEQEQVALSVVTRPLEARAG